MNKKVLETITRGYELAQQQKAEALTLEGPAKLAKLQEAFSSADITGIIALEEEAHPDTLHKIGKLYEEIRLAIRELENPRAPGEITCILCGADKMQGYLCPECGRCPEDEQPPRRAEIVPLESMPWAVVGCEE